MELCWVQDGEVERWRECVNRILEVEKLVECRSSKALCYAISTLLEFDINIYVSTLYFTYCVGQLVH